MKKVKEKSVEQEERRDDFFSLVLRIPLARWGAMAIYLIQLLRGVQLNAWELRDGEKTSERAPSHRFLRPFSIIERRDFLDTSADPADCIY